MRRMNRNLPILMAIGLCLALPSSVLAAPVPDVTVQLLSASEAGISLKDWAIILSPFISAIIGIAALIGTVKNTKRQIESANTNAAAQRWKEANQKEIERLEAMLSTFHTPYLVRSEADKLMAEDLRDRMNDPNYRLLIKLFDPNWQKSLPSGDQALVDEICAAGQGLQKLIEEASGGVDPVLVEHLSRAITHFRILSLAHKQELGVDPKPFQRYVYPRQLDLALKVDRERVLSRLRTLRSAPSDDHGQIQALHLPVDARLDPWPSPPRPQTNGY
jgi:hypothetical protein